MRGGVVMSPLLSWGIVLCLAALVVLFVKDVVDR